MSAFDGIDAREALQRIIGCMDRIEEGSLFCMDRNLPWTLKEEERAGRSHIAEAFAAFPELAAMMPERAGRLARGELLGKAIYPSEVTNALKALGVKRPNPNF